MILLHVKAATVSISIISIISISIASCFVKNILTVVLLVFIWPGLLQVCQNVLFPKVNIFVQYSIWFTRKISIIKYILYNTLYKKLIDMQLQLNYIIISIITA